MRAGLGAPKARVSSLKVHRFVCGWVHRCLWFVHLCVCMCGYVCKCVSMCVHVWLCMLRGKRRSQPLSGNQRKRSVFKSPITSNHRKVCLGEVPPKHSLPLSAMVIQEMLKIAWESGVHKMRLGRKDASPVGYLIGDQRAGLGHSFCPVPAELCYHLVGLRADSGREILWPSGHKGNPWIKVGGLPGKLEVQLVNI